MEKRPRRARPIERRTKDITQEVFRNCDVPECQNIISMEGWSKTYSGPVFCSIHRSHYTKKT